VDHLFQHGTITGSNDGQTLQQLLANRDELALETLVAKHGALVLSICRRLLKSPHDIDDAFQATFLILVRKAPVLRNREQLGPWLHGVAYRVAMRARADITRRRALEQIHASDHAGKSIPGAETLAVRAELCELVDREIAQLSAAHRAAIVLCDLEGQTMEDAALQLGWSQDSLRGRLARARRKLRDRLARRGVAPTALTTNGPTLGVALVPDLPVSLVENTTRAGLATLLAGRAAPTAASAISASVAALVKGVLRTMTVSKATALIGLVVFVAAGLVALAGLVRAGRATIELSSINPSVAGPSDAKPEPLQEKSRTVALELRVIDKSDKQPIAGVDIAVSCRVRQSAVETKARTDPQGRSVVTLPDTASHVSVSFSKDGFVPKRVVWGENSERPESYTEELERGLPIGGFVKDEEGKPIAGALVTVGLAQARRDEPDPDLPSRSDIRAFAAFPVLNVKTDSDGRWRCSILPADADQGTRLWFHLEHPDFVSDTSSYSRRLSLKTARAMTGALVMRTGLRVAGQVHDGKGRFIAGAKVTLAYSPSGGNFLRTSTDAAGRFVFRNAEHRSGLRRWSVSVESPGFAPAWQMIVPHQGIAPLEFSLRPSLPFRGQVVDNHGKPVAGANVEVQWQECYFLDWKAETDGAGRFVWLDGPEDGEIVFNVRKEAFTTAMGRRTSAKEGSVAITINPRIRVLGTVVDAQTGKPIPKFRIIEGETNGNSRVFWRDRSGEVASEGHFDVSPFVYDQPGIAFFIRAVADGYLPASSRAISPGESQIVLDFKLEKGTGPTGVVKLPDGSPAVGADVYLNEPRKYGLPLENNRQELLSPGPDQFWVKTDENGRFRFEPKDEPFGVLVLHPEGVAQKSAGELAKSPTLVLEPFGRIEGTLRIGSELGTRQPIRVQLDRSAYLAEFYQFFH